MGVVCFQSAHVLLAKASHVAKLKVSGGRKCILPTANPGQDEEVRMNWDQLISLNILWILQVGWSRGYLIREPGSSLMISESKVGVLERR